MSPLLAVMGLPVSGAGVNKMRSVGKVDRRTEKSGIKAVELAEYSTAARAATHKRGPASKDISCQVAWDKC